MNKIALLIFVTLILQSCCVYHEERKLGNKKTSEFGVAPYKNRPIENIKR